ncbi:MAG: hypothetical protein JW904_05190 [Spirochaetales bacterium]|nr:hypothetical protein [Spirochaetales bacterium]
MAKAKIIWSQEAREDFLNIKNYKVLNTELLLIAAVLIVMFAFFVAALLSVSAQEVVQDSGGYNNSCHFAIKAA